MSDIYNPQEEPQAVKFKPDPYFNNFKIKTVQNSYRKGEQYLGWNCNGQIIATAQNKIRLFRLNNSNYNFEVDKNEQKYHDSQSVDFLSWHPTNPDLMAYITKQPNYYIWDIKDKNPRKISNKVQPDNLNIIFSPDGNTIALFRYYLSLENEYLHYYLPIKYFRLRYKYSKSTEMRQAIKYEEQIIILYHNIGNRDNKLSFFDVRKDEELHTAQFDFDIHEFQWNPTGSVIMIVGNYNQSGILHVCDGKDYSKANIDLLEKVHVECHSMKIQCIAVDPKGKYFATGSTDTLVGLWDQSEFVMLKTFTQSDFAIDKLSFSRDGLFLSSLFNDKTIQIYNTSTGQLFKTHI